MSIIGEGIEGLVTKTLHTHKDLTYNNCICYDNYSWNRSNYLIKLTLIITVKEFIFYADFNYIT